MNTTTIDKKLELRTYWTWMGNDGIARTVVKPQAEIELDDAIENSKAVNSLYQGVKFPLLVDSRAVKSMSMEARKYLSVNNRSTNISSFAVVVSSPLSRIVVNFFFKLQRTGVPARVFTNEQLAMDWLRQFLTHEGEK